MNSTDERLSDLLAERARQGSGVHPTREGVSVALTRRGARRRRKRAVVTGMAGLGLVAGVVGGLALTGDDGGEDGFTAPTGAPPEVPLVGLDIEGFIQEEPQIGDLQLDDEPARTVVVFRSGGSLADPFVTVAVQPPIDGVPPEVRGDPIDLDGDGVDDAGLGGNDAGMGIEWRLSDGSVAMVGAELVDAGSEDALIAYAGEVFGPTLDLDDLPSPAGLPERDTWTVPDPRGPDEARVRYEADDGSGRWITVSTTNQPGYFDLLQDSSANPFEGFGFEETVLGPSFLGSGRAIVFDSYSGPGRDYALIRTDTALTLEITTGCRSGRVCRQPALDAGTIRDVIQTGAFVDVEPTEGPPTTTALAPATTTPVTSTSTSIVPSSQALQLTDVRHAFENGVETVELAFDHGIPEYRNLTLLESPPEDCPDADSAEAIFREGQNTPYWNRWLTVEVDARTPPVDPDALPLEGQPYVLCSSGDAPNTIAIPVRNLGEPTVTPLSGRPVLFIDIPR